MNTKHIKASLVLDSQLVSKHTFEFVKWCQNSSIINIDCLIKISKQEQSKYNLLSKFLPNSLLWKIILKAESFKIKKTLNSEYEKNYDLSTLVEKTIIIHQSRFKHNKKNFLEENQTRKIKDLNLDLHIAFEFNDLLGKFRETSKLGIFVVHKGQPEKVSIGPLGFEEVLNKNSKTGFTIIRYSKEKDYTSVVQSGFFSTQNYFSANRENVFLRRNYYIQKLMRSIFEDEIYPEDTHIVPDLASVPETPSFFYQLNYLRHIFIHILNKIVAKITKKEELWNVAISKGNWTNIDMKNSFIVDNPDNHYLADPFVISENNRDFCFVEDFNIKESKGTISVYEILNNTAMRLGGALVEPFHLAFPYLFRFESKIYMLPETSENRDIRVYESIEFPLRWRLKKVLMKDIFAADSMLFEHNTKWWLFSNINFVGGTDVCSELFIFYADHPFSEKWIPHKKNPLIVDPSKARNGGILFQKDEIYRVGQRQEFGVYGRGFSINKILALDTEEYEEKTISRVRPDFFKKIIGTHHLHSNGDYSVFDFRKS